MPIKLRPLIAALPLAVVLAGPVIGQSNETQQIDMVAIEQAYQRNDFVTVRDGLAELAKDDSNALAHYRYGRVLLQGLGGPADRTAAVGWLQKAVAQNHVEAATLLARVYLAEGEYYNAEEAAKLLSNAAARGDAEAQYYLALMYQRGQGLDQDLTQAFSWFLAAAENSNTNAKFELSKVYSRGQGTAENVEEALRWLTEAASDGHAEAQYFLANAYENGPENFRAPNQALEWYRRAAEGNMPLAQRALGTKYMLGENGIEPNAEEALRWLTAAANADDAGAMQNLATGYLSGDVLPQDDQLAAHWFEQASQLGLGRSSFGLGSLYQVGRGVPADLEKAVSLYRLATSQGEKRAALRIGNMALDGTLNGTMAPHDTVPFVLLILQETESADALSWLSQQADAGVRPAQEQLGLWYVDVKGDAEQGAALLEVAATNGSVPAQARLGALYSTGDGVELDYVTAHKWLNVAAASGSSDAAETRNLINELMTPEQVAQAQAAAREFLDSAGARAPQTDQIVRDASGQVIAPASGD